MPVTTYVLSTMEHAVQIGTRLPQSWFRGHATVCGELTPKIYRAQYQETWETDPWFECKMIKEFIRSAIPVMADPPEVGQKIRWIFLMQHHGAPTKLLDWTENVLVGLYFAVQDAAGENGELWALRPLALNEMHQVRLPNRTYKLNWVPCADEAEAKPILEYFERDPCEDLEEGDPGRVEYPLALKPALHFPRMARQLSTFTIHPRSTRKVRPIHQILSSPRDLVRYIVPQSRKSQLRDDLVALGISERALFADLDALSRSLMREYEKHGDGRVPEPPVCDGLWGER